MVSRVRQIQSVVEGGVTFNDEQGRLAEFLDERYLSGTVEAVRCVAPQIMGSKFVRVVRLSDSARSAAQFEGSGAQTHILEVLRTMGGEAKLEELRKRARVNGFSSAVSTLIRKRLLLEESGVSRPQTVGRSIRAYQLGPTEKIDSHQTSAAGKRIVDALSDLAKSGHSPAFPELLLGKAQAGTAALKTLVDAGVVEVVLVPSRRQAVVVVDDRTAPPKLTRHQHAAVSQVAAMIDSGRPERALLFGVTASGKTEVYLNAIERTLAAGRNAIVLVPEIALTTQVVSVFIGRFGDEVAVLHSRLSDGERHDEWRRLQEGQARIAVGARSAVFAPLDNLGLIVVDEEHEASDKQESAPRYLTRDVAAERTRTSGVLLLGSATPSVETYFASEQGQIERLEMPSRIDDRPLPEIEVVDMREEFQHNRALFSTRLADELARRLSRGEQSILFLNRRGFAQFVLCRDCGYVARCPHCAVSLAFHAAWGSLKCHHCGHSRRAPVVCPECKGDRVKGFGIGTERVEDEVKRSFPSARVARLDRDTTTRKGSHLAILDQFRKGEADVLIGTQMVAKGLDFPNVTLVGVVSADTSINMPDFRAAERTFQLLTQVAGRAGRGSTPGRVIVQTFTPDHYSVQAARSQNYRAFYDQELRFRKELLYPPFRRFANIVASDSESAVAKARAEVFAAALRRQTGGVMEVIGPSQSALSKLKNQYRWHVEVRAPPEAPLSAQVRTALAELTSSERSGLVVDIDPYNLA
jgi:primosomal protein N' (replication factor Y)